MLWPFNHFRKPRIPSRGTIEAIYGMIVTQAREPLFYRDFGVPDTVNGRFDLLVLHLWMVLRRLKPIEGGAGLAQTLFDRFCDDMDANLREMGVGDLTVPKRMQAFGEAFYGRAAAYDLALAAGRGAVGASAVQEHPERRGNRKRAAAGCLCRGGHRCPGRNGRGEFAERIVEISRAGLIGARHRAAMNRMKTMTDHADPWSVPVIVAQIPDTGLHREIEADQAARDAMADVAGLREILSASASLDLTPEKAGRVHVTGRVRARIGQTCVVSLDPIENDIDEAIDLIFAPPEQIPELADLVDEAAESDAEIPDPPEPIVNGVIDLGRLATDALFLGIDPYPRKPDAVFEPMIEAADPEDHPFAALKALRPDAKPRGPKKPKNRVKSR